MGLKPHKWPLLHVVVQWKPLVLRRVFEQALFPFGFSCFGFQCPNLGTKQTCRKNSWNIRVGQMATLHQLQRSKYSIDHNCKLIYCSLWWRQNGCYHWNFCGCNVGSFPLRIQWEIQTFWWINSLNMFQRHWSSHAQIWTPILATTLGKKIWDSKLFLVVDLSTVWCEQYTVSPWTPRHDRPEAEWKQLGWDWHLLVFPLVFSLKSSWIWPQRMVDSNWRMLCWTWSNSWVMKYRKHYPDRSFRGRGNGFLKSFQRSFVRCWICECFELWHSLYEQKWCLEDDSFALKVHKLTGVSMLESLVALTI